MPSPATGEATANRGRDSRDGEYVRAVTLQSVPVTMNAQEIDIHKATPKDRELQVGLKLPNSTHL